MIERIADTRQKAAFYLKEVNHRLADTIPLKNAIRAPE